MSSESQRPPGLSELQNYPLVQALAFRRSRRFSAGATIGGGGLQYKSKLPPAPLTDIEEAVLGFAASGINGLNLGDFPHQPAPGEEPTGGNVMAMFSGRLGASADAVHSVAVFVINDEGTSFLKRPQDFDLAEIDQLGALARDGDYTAIYKRLKVPLSDERTVLPREVPYIFPFNKWSTNLPGTTYFLPVSEMSSMYINILLSAFDEANAFYLVDDRHSFLPAGLKRFAKSRGGSLEDDPDGGRVFPIQALESIILEFVMAEQAFLAHNLSLMEQAMGLGGWTHYASATEAAWFEKLGFSIGGQTVAQKLNAGPIKRLILTLLGQNLTYPYALGLNVGGTDLIKPFCPPYYKTMKDAVLAYREFKLQNVVHVPLGEAFAGAWKEPKVVQKTIPKFSDACIEATIAYCEYVYETYGRFPAYFGPLRTAIAHQAHHLDLEFYDTHYTAGAYSETQARHQELWHSGKP